MYNNFIFKLKNFFKKHNYLIFIWFVSFKDSQKNKILNFKTSLKFKKFLVTKAPFKYNKTKEQYFLNKFKSLKKTTPLLPKIYESFFIYYFLLSNIKFFFFFKLEKVLNV